MEGEFCGMETGPGLLVYAAPRRLAAWSKLDCTSSINSGGGNGLARKITSRPWYSDSASVKPLNTITGTQLSLARICWTNPKPLHPGIR